MTTYITCEAVPDCGGGGGGIVTAAGTWFPDAPGGNACIGTTGLTWNVGGGAGGPLNITPALLYCPGMTGTGVAMETFAVCTGC